MDATEYDPIRYAFRCQLDYDGVPCGGTVYPKGIDGRFILHRGVMINLPSHVLLPRCNCCRADYMIGEFRTVVNKVLEEEYRRHDADIQKAIKAYCSQPGRN